MSKRWHYNTIEEFYHRYYDKLLTENLISGNEMYIEEYKDKDGIPTELGKHLFPLKKGKLIYLIPTEAVNKLPIMVLESEKMSYQAKGYRLVTKYKPMKIMPREEMSFKKLVDTFAKVKHSNPEHDFYWRLLSIISFIDRINIRVATNPEFGKDSKLNIINSLTGEVGKISNPTIAKLEYLLFNKVLFINEVAGINSQSKQDVEQFILQCGDFNNEYTKRSRASAGTSEKYDIKDMSLVIAYNDINQYGSKRDKYFDFMWVNTGAVNNRILPFLLQGRIEEDFTEVFDVYKQVEENYNFYIKFLRTLLYFREYKVTSLKFEQPEFKFQSERWQRNFSIVNKYVDLYAENQAEYERIIKGLYKSHLEYLKGVGYNNSEEATDQHSSPSLIENYAYEKESKEILDYLDMNGETDIERLLRVTNTTESTIGKLKEEGLIYEKSGRINLL